MFTVGAFVSIAQPQSWSISVIKGEPSITMSFMAYGTWVRDSILKKRSAWVRIYNLEGPILPEKVRSSERKFEWMSVLFLCGYQYKSQGFSFLLKETTTTRLHILSLVVSVVVPAWWWNLREICCLDTMKTLSKYHNHTHVFWYVVQMKCYKAKEAEKFALQNRSSCMHPSSS